MRNPSIPWLFSLLPIRVPPSLFTPRPPWTAVWRAIEVFLGNMSRSPTTLTNPFLRWKLWEETVPLSEQIGYRLVRSDLYTAAIISRLEEFGFAFYFPTYQLERQGPIEWRNHTRKKTRTFAHQLNLKTMQMKQRSVEAMHQKRRMLQRQRGWSSKPRTLTPRNRYSLLLKVMLLNSPCVVAGQGDLRRTVSCPSENAQNLPGSRSWPRNVKPTAGSLRLLLTDQKPARLLPLLEILSVRPVVRVLQPQVFLLLLPLVPLSLVALNRLVPNRRSESIPRGRSQMARSWTLLFRPWKAAANFPWNSARKNLSRLPLSRSASRHGHRRPTIHQNPRTRPRIWPSLHTTMLCLFSMLLRMLGRR